METLRLPKVGFGTYRIKKIEPIIEAIKIGYRHIDTAELYKNEHLVRDAVLYARKDLKIQDPINITTKISKESILGGKIRESFEERIKIFGYIDVLLLHVPSDDCRRDWEELCDLYKNSDKIGSIGVSNYDVEHLEQLKDCKIKPQYNQIELSPFCTRMKLIEMCDNMKIEIIAHSSLIDKKKFNHPTIRYMAEEYNASPASILLAWAKCNNFYVIPKSENPQHMKENLFCNIMLKSIDIDCLEWLDENLRVIKINDYKKK